jgi:hypothetical protein
MLERRGAGSRLGSTGPFKRGRAESRFVWVLSYELVEMFEPADELPSCGIDHE